MLKMLKILIVFAFIFGTMLNANDKYTKENYPIKSHHDELGLKCTNCHKEKDPKDYKRLSTEDCLSCHKSYKNLAELTSYLGYDNNVHASPHYPNMDCTACHSSHKKSKNYCVMCHSQDIMKKIVVP